MSGWALTTEIYNELTFRYEYDGDRRMIMKKIPGASEIYMVYDARDRLVLSQDGNMRAQNKWLYIQYDSINRQTNTGLWNNSSSRATHQTSAGASIAYPNLSGQTYEVLISNYYDNYSWSGNPFGSSRSTAGDTYLAAASNTTYPYPQAVTQSSMIKGLLTGTKVKVLGTSTYLYNIFFYDDKGRIIQKQSKNLSGGTDIITTQYTWTGLPYIVVNSHQKLGTGAQTSIVLTRNTYDDLGRTSKIEKRISHSSISSGTMPSTWTTVVQNEYDALGQLGKRKLETNLERLPERDWQTRIMIIIYGDGYCQLIKHMLVAV